MYDESDGMSFILVKEAKFKSLKFHNIYVPFPRWLAEYSYALSPLSVIYVKYCKLKDDIEIY